MCEVRVKHYATCAHQSSEGYNRCQAARARPGQEICIPATGNIRDLPRALDIQDQNIAGPCPVCKGNTPPSSAGSQ